MAIRQEPGVELHPVAQYGAETPHLEVEETADLEGRSLKKSQETERLLLVSKIRYKTGTQERERVFEKETTA